MKATSLQYEFASLRLFYEAHQVSKQWNFLSSVFLTCWKDGDLGHYALRK